jgi:hypothetical protein
MTYLITIGLVLAMMLGWIVVERLANLFAHRHPEFGPPRKLGCGGCGNNCEGHCKNEH